jgi:hypothetical protein
MLSGEWEQAGFWLAAFPQLFLGAVYFVIDAPRCMVQWPHSTAELGLAGSSVVVCRFEPKLGVCLSW